MKRQYSLTFYKSEFAQCKYILKENEIRSQVSEFLMKYVSIEAFYKKLLAAEKESKGKKLTKSERKNLRVQTADVKRVLEHFGIEFEEDLIERIFGSNDNNYMDCSIKKLRDRLVHHVNDSVIRVILERRESINADLDEFVGLFGI